MKGAVGNLPKCNACQAAVSSNRGICLASFASAHDDVAPWGNCRRSQCNIDILQNHSAKIHRASLGLHMGRQDQQSCLPNRLSAQLHAMQHLIAFWQQPSWQSPLSWVCLQLQEARRDMHEQVTPKCQSGTPDFSLSSLCLRDS